MAWTQLEDTFHDHPKFRRLAKRLAVPIPYARGCVAGLWSWATRHAPDGDLSDFEPDDIAHYSGWEGDANLYVTACVEVELFEQTEHGLRIHQFRAESLKRAEVKRKERERKRAMQRVARPSHDRRENVVKERRGEERRGEERKREERRGEDLNPLSSSHGEPDRTDELGQVAQVFAHYRTHHEHSHRKPKRESKEWRCIEARLREGYSVEDLRSAIDGCHLTPHNLGENERNEPYLGLELIMRTGSQVTRFRETAIRHANGPPPVLSEREQRGKRAGQQWAERKRQAEQQQQPASEVIDAAG